MDSEIFISSFSNDREIILPNELSSFESDNKLDAAKYAVAIVFMFSILENLGSRQNSSISS